MDQATSKTWRVTLMPHRSLSREGFIAVMAAVAGTSAIGGFVFLIAGAWPVTGFIGLDVALVWWAFKANFADARRAESIEITASEVILERRAEGRDTTVQRFIRRWLRVEIDHDADRQLVGALYLASHGLRTEIGTFLNGPEKLALAAELRAQI